MRRRRGSAVASAGRTRQRSSMWPDCRALELRATALFGAASGSSSTRTCAPRSAAREQRADHAPLAQARRAKLDLVARRRGARAHRACAPRIAPSVRNRASMEPGPPAAAARRRGQPVVAARPGGDLELARGDVAREVARDLHGEIRIRGCRQKAHPAAGAVVGDEQPTLIRLASCDRAQQRAQARLAGVLVERVAPPPDGEAPERRVERNGVAQSIEPHARDDHAGPLEGLEVLDRRAAIGLAARIGHQHDLDVRPLGPLQEQPVDPRRARAALRRARSAALARSMAASSRASRIVVRRPTRHDLHLRLGEARREARPRESRAAAA